MTQQPNRAERDCHEWATIALIALRTTGRVDPIVPSGCLTATRQDFAGNSRSQSDPLLQIWRKKASTNPGAVQSESERLTHQLQAADRQEGQTTPPGQKVPQGTALDKATS